MAAFLSAPSAETYAEVAQQLAAMPRIAVTAAATERALEVQAMLARDGRHRAASIPDLLVAACAELNGLVVLHYDADYELIAEVTGQVHEWVVPKGSVS